MIYTTILVIFVIAILAVLIVASQKPGDFLISRSINIKAKPESIFPLINDFHEWEKWSPYEHIDADLKKTFSGTKSGIGTIYEYEGKKAGAGRMEITASNESDKITLKLILIKPIPADNIVNFKLEQKDDVTKVTWEMKGKNKLLNKIADLVLNIDKLVGKDFEKGLKDLKKVVEKNEN
jgi:hypothetical protein